MPTARAEPGRGGFEPQAERGERVEHEEHLDQERGVPDDLDERRGQPADGAPPGEPGERHQHADRQTGSHADHAEQDGVGQPPGEERPGPRDDRDVEAH
jgi:hypothetical protein